MTSIKPLSQPLSTVEEIVAQEKALALLHFTSEDAFELGVLIRNRLRDISDKPAVINIALANRQQLLFHATSRCGTVPENDNWVRRKRNVVLRFGMSTWAAHIMFDKGDEEKFKKMFQLGDRSEDYAIHGGGYPVRVVGVEGPVAAVVVSGLASEEDHQVIVECLQEMLTAQKTTQK
ncbi:uncharacterized protein L3040_001069 [Drepanopeziza brunnea f. sp. 'multigermtubi']|uniref:DUF967 domain protein n=1 Tax=Marssonina brunnea f. sp. multigermtubi (strain MB_m1) TaxID=1072389 RepID=K1WAY4_MARBU|nr:DUF967 domain protein [Drepanopeziza brunnea f. sp. 'multigermtubi' MB_m1]EKD14455.1 DUF967 domain protein [Drepanopeziza brunnea f. sp. 'multigermtubi' MB_m1]KAJ5054805.1 hypothetical protein L3040_001069 [Drepanopeziza brunnea f. sp. 'multigermtubi']